MNWGDIADKVKSVAGDALPMIGSIAGGSMGEKAGSLIASALGVDNNPDSVAKALESDPQALQKLKQAEMEHARELRSMYLEAETAQMKQINETMRRELEADSLFKSGWRPWIGWLTGTGMGGILGVLAWSIMQDPASAPEIIQQATTVLAFMLTVLGVNVKKRSDDKLLKSGKTPPEGAVSRLVSGLTKNR